MFPEFLEYIEDVPIPVAVTDDKNLIAYYNTTFSKLVSNNELKQQNIEKLFRKWEVYGIDLVLSECEQGTYVLYFDYYEYEGKKFVLYVIPDGNILQLLYQKISELKDMSTVFDAIVENSLDAIYITDYEGNTLNVSPSIEKLFGFPKERFIGKNVKEFLNEGKFKESMTLKVLEKRDMVNSVGEIDSLNLKTAIPVAKENGEIFKVVTFVRNLTELNRIYDELNHALKQKNQYKEELEKIKETDVIIKSKEMKDIYEIAERMAKVDATILILGETGVGKDEYANHLYQLSDRFDKGRFIKVNCGAIPNELLESELFGYEAGAFTGAKQSGKYGMFELAHQGMLFLDEVGELPLELQVKLLRVLQEKQIQRIGSSKSTKINVRLIAATNRNLKEMVNKGEFREDLYYRLNVVPITIPPLRERKEEILPLVYNLVKKTNQKYNYNKMFDHNLHEFFYRYYWPGNIRELSNLVERLILTVSHTLIKAEDIPLEYRNTVKVPEDPLSSDENLKINEAKIMPLKEAVEEAERHTIANAVKKYKSTYKIAEELQTSQTTVVRKIKKYNL